MKVVINKSYGGFHLSQEAMDFLGTTYASDYNRTDSRLVECVEQLGDKASGTCSRLEVVEIPDNSYFVIHENDGLEKIHFVDSRQSCRAPARKVVLNSCYGGFELSQEAMDFLGTKNCMEYANDRTNPRLIECVEALREKASGFFSQLEVAEIPADTHFVIDEYDGCDCLYLLDEQHSYKTPKTIFSTNIGENNETNRIPLWIATVIWVGACVLTGVVVSRLGLF